MKIETIKNFGPLGDAGVSVELDNGMSFKTCNDVHLVILLYEIMRKLDLLITATGRQIEAINWQGGRIPEDMLKAMREEDR